MAVIGACCDIVVRPGSRMLSINRVMRTEEALLYIVVNLAVKIERV